MRHELEEYIGYCTPHIVKKYINQLAGLVHGIKIDRAIERAEMDELVHWCTLVSTFCDKPPFSEIYPVVEKAVADGRLDDDEIADIIWLCDRVLAEKEKDDSASSSIQFLMGLLHGLMADGRLEGAEIILLNDWINDNDFLRGTYPYDELESLLLSILADGVISEKEKDILTAFVSEFIDDTMSCNVVKPDMEKLRAECSVQGICAANPDISIEGKNICFTGESYRAKRREIEAVILEHQGIFNSDVKKDTDILVIGSSGNPCWMYSCYGRKVEKAVKLRKEGHRIMIVHETDFWDAIA